MSHTNHTSLAADLSGGGDGEPILEARDLEKFYAQPDGARIEVISPTNIKIMPGQILSLLGPSGCGKSTLLRMLTGRSNLPLEKRSGTSGRWSPCYNADFYPFGGERDAINTTCPQNYKFEGKERDTETNNDDFGARYYSWRLGRWLSADWSAVPAPVPYANLTNPQTLNLYGMVSDNPETFADLDGHMPTLPPAKEGAWQAEQAELDELLNINQALDPTVEQDRDNAHQQAQRQQTAQPPPAQDVSK